MSNFLISPVDTDMKSLDRSGTLQNLSSPGIDPGYKGAGRNASDQIDSALQRQLYRSPTQSEILDESENTNISTNTKMGANIDMLSPEEQMLVQMPDPPTNPLSTAGNAQHPGAAIRSKPRKQPSSSKLSQGPQGGESDDFEMDESIQKSTIMMKRLRSKSESKKFDNEYEGSSDSGPNKHGQGPAFKRHLQNHWRDGTPGLLTSPAVLPSDPRAYLPLQDPREDGGCVICQQAYDSPDNQIVLCDSCDRGYHQRCYSPPIDSKYVEIADLEWTCFVCSQPLSTTSSQGLSMLTEDMSLTGQQLAQDIRENYLMSLPKKHLVKLIGKIEAVSPAVKIYPSHLSSPTTPQADKEGFTTPTIAGALMPVEVAQGSTQGVSSGSSYQGVQGAQADYFESFVNHFQPVLSSPLSSIQESATNGGGAQADSSGSGATGTSTQGASTGKISKPGTPTAHRASGRQTPGSSSGTGVTGTYNSVKAQDLPPYEEMIFMAIADLKQEAGSAPKAILDWVQAHYPVPETFRASCGQAISKAAKKGRLLKDGAMYKLKPGYSYARGGGRATRHAGSTRARSQSYNSALPPGIPAIDAASRNSPLDLPFDPMNPIMDQSLYGILPSPTFQITPQSGAATGFPGNASMGIPQRTSQTLPFKFGANPGLQRMPTQDTVGSSMDTTGAGGGVSGLVGLGVSNVASGFAGENDQGGESDNNTGCSPSMSSVSSGQHSFTGTFQGAEAAVGRNLQVIRPKEDLSA
ncbi:hypothetical protein BGZ98_002656 [Dissophora globulifera]|nr:hypothetical protein BGZ98_002656 [Dissophora globulifera]